ncbi:hypothetical protein B188_13630 [Candidatus Brocadiaceae bacterium B188]|nr:class I SAM-dependent methyltransferase [Candidatus Brocadia sapporoensis]QQR66438.1 MAG: class I SAM-dependent methyltransferase [Candidatus Brocadia sp.]RZV58750.1 MAG: class I SAM-dependent methyltransferase [Candidatus Brocadia sp. BROELEC01]TWU53396.1 hypothetical protein B188_13630 [Candidatus Brocadiaceae bacterium B188]
MGLKTFLGIKKYQWKKSVKKFITKVKKDFPQYPWDDFLRITEYFRGRELSSLSERAFLFRLSHDLPSDAKVVEIGSWIGASSCLLASGLKGTRAKMYAIDNFKGNASDCSARIRYRERMSKLKTDTTKVIFDKNITYFNLENRIVAIVNDSLQAAKGFCEPLHSIDLVFIDGDHSEEATKNDIALWLPFVKSGGIVVFHDFTSNHGVPQAVWWAIKQSYFSELIGIYGSTIAFKVS